MILLDVLADYYWTVNRIGNQIRATDEDLCAVYIIRNILTMFLFYILSILLPVTLCNCQLAALSASGSLKPQNQTYLSEKTRTVKNTL